MLSGSWSLESRLCKYPKGLVHHPWEASPQRGTQLDHHTTPHWRYVYFCTAFSVSCENIPLLITNIRWPFNKQCFLSVSIHICLCQKKPPNKLFTVYPLPGTEGRGAVQSRFSQCQLRRPATKYQNSSLCLPCIGDIQCSFSTCMFLYWMQVVGKTCLA